MKLAACVVCGSGSCISPHFGGGSGLKPKVRRWTVENLSLEQGGRCRCRKLFSAARDLTRVAEGARAPSSQTGESFPYLFRHRNVIHDLRNDFSIFFGMDSHSRRSWSAWSKVRKESWCHLDPDLRTEAIPRQSGWRPAFGQADGEQTHLADQVSVRATCSFSLVRSAESREMAATVGVTSDPHRMYICFSAGFRFMRFYRFGLLRTTTALCASIRGFRNTHISTVLLRNATTVFANVRTTRSTCRLRGSILGE